MVTSSQPESLTFVISGGAGKNVAATAVVRALKKAHPETLIHIVTAWPEVWISNPRVASVYRYGRTEQYYAQVVQGRRTRLVHPEPYTHPDYVYQERHLLDVWCEQAGVTWDGQPGELFLSADELALARAFVAAQPKPTLLFQPFAGPAPEQASTLAHLKHQGRMQRRSLPLELAQALVDQLSATYTVLHARLPEQPELAGTVPVIDHLRVLAALSTAVDRRLFVDSFLQHAAAALGQPAVVCWAGTSPTLLGYDLHHHLVREVCPTPTCGRPNSYLFDTNALDLPWTCPHQDACLHHPVAEVIAAIAAKEVSHGLTR